MSHYGLDMNKNNFSSVNIISEKIVGSYGCLGVITLQRAEAYNALTLDMCIEIYQQLLRWQVDDDIKAIWLESGVDKVFCAGGDIKQLYLNQDNIEKSLNFFQYEYALNELIYYYPKPFISMWDGIAMGGGLGISQHGRFRIATNNLRWAMPEVSIGFFPDIGAGYFLSRLSYHMGYYLGLTGYSIGLGDAIDTGLATHAIAEDKIQSVKQALLDCPWTADGHQDVGDILQRYHQRPKQGLLYNNKDKIDRCFGGDSVANIVESLQQENSWGCELTAHIAKQCPLSVAVTFQQLQRAQHLDFLDEMQQERKICRYFLDQPCLYEGIRAAVIDKDRRPAWPDLQVADHDMGFSSAIF